MRLISIEATNFKVFERIKLDLSDKNSFVLVTGKNDQQPKSGSNGAGKSSLFDAICYGLYGKSAKGKIAGKLKKRGTSGGYGVVLKFDDFTVKRTWSPNSLQLDGHEVKQDAIDDKIKFTYDQFLNGVYFRQNPEHFIDLTPGEKLDFLSNIFQLDSWSKLADLAKSKATMRQVEQGQITIQLQTLSGELASIDDNVLALKTKQTEWDAEEKTAIDNEKAELAQLQALSEKWEAEKLNTLRRKLEEYDSIQTSLPEVTDATTLKERQSVLITEDVDLRLDLKEKAVAAKQKEVGGHEAALNLMKQQFDKLLASTGSICPSCSQVVTEEHVHKCGEDLLLIMDQTNAQFIAEGIKLDEMKEQLAQDHTKSDKLHGEINLLHIEIDTLEVKKKQREQLEKQLTGLQEDIERNEKTTNPHQSRLADLAVNLTLPRVSNPFQFQIDKLKDREKALGTEIKDLTKKQLDLDIQIGEFTFWKENFPQLRLLILNEVVAELELHFNNAFYNLGITGWTVIVKTERELKDERTKRELSLQVLSTAAGFEEEIDLDMLSGGEEQRVRLASAIGIGDLIRGRTGVSWLFSIYDEPSLGLSEEGVVSMLEYFSVLAEYGQVYVADHRLGFWQFDRTICVHKDKSGTSMIEETSRELVAV